MRKSSHHRPRPASWNKQSPQQSPRAIPSASHLHPYTRASPTDYTLAPISQRGFPLAVPLGFDGSPTNSATSDPPMSRNGLGATYPEEFIDRSFAYEDPANTPQSSHPHYSYHNVPQPSTQARSPFPTVQPSNLSSSVPTSHTTPSWNDPNERPFSTEPLRRYQSSGQDTFNHAQSPYPTQPADATRHPYMEPWSHSPKSGGGRYAVGSSDTFAIQSRIGFTDYHTQGPHDTSSYTHYSKRPDYHAGGMAMPREVSPTFREPDLVAREPYNWSTFPTAASTVEPTSLSGPSTGLFTTSPSTSATTGNSRMPKSHDWTKQDLTTGSDSDVGKKRAKKRAKVGDRVVPANPLDSSSARDQIASLCDELCHLAANQSGTSNSITTTRMSELSRRIITQLSGIATETGFEDLAVSAETLEAELFSLSLGNQERREGEESSRYLAKPTSVMNIQTPQEAARDMQIIRARRDELTAKAAAGKEKEREEKERLAGELSPTKNGSNTQHEQDTSTRSLSAPHESNGTALVQRIISPIPFEEPRASLQVEVQTNIPQPEHEFPSRYPYRYSTYESFMAFPHVPPNGVPLHELTLTASENDANRDQTRNGSSHGSNNEMGLETGTSYQPHVIRACHSCGIMHTPEWKMGPDGPDTLCNACGAHWLEQNHSDMWSRLGLPIEAYSTITEL